MPQLADRLQKLLDQAARDHIFPGAAVAVVQDKQSPLFVCSGSLRYETSESVSPNSIYDVASITKAIPTSCLALQALAEEKVYLDSPITPILPEFQPVSVLPITLRHLLTQTLDFNLQLSSLKTLSADEIWEKICTERLNSLPGSQHSYCNATSVVLGKVVAKIWQQPLEKAANSVFFTPLSMTDTGFAVPQEKLFRTAPSEIDSEWRGKELCGEVHDESAWVFAQAGEKVGSAGLFSSVNDLAKFVKILLPTKEFKNSYFSSALVSEMERNQFPDQQESRGLGWELAQSWMGAHKTERTFGKTGFTGCSILVDRERQVGIVLLSNATYPARPTDREKIFKIRHDIMTEVLSDFS